MAVEKKSAFGPLFLAATVIVSAFGVSFSVHETRKLTNKSQQLQREQNHLHTEWGQLLLEHSTWGGYARVERIAREELNMIQPTSKQRVVVRP